MNNFIPKKCKTCKYLSIDSEDGYYCCNKIEEYLTKYISDKCKQEATE